MPQITAEFPEKLRFLVTEPWRYKVAYGGRGGVKSWSCSQSALIHGTGQTYFNRPLRILCAREIQKSIRESVHALLCGQIDRLGLTSFYRVQETSITGRNGTEFIFAGLKHNVNSIKSLEDVDIVWVEEAQTVSKQSWEILIPTIRKSGSEIWVTFNPDLDTDDTYQRFVVNPPKNAKVVKIGWQDNKWLSAELRQEMEDLKQRDPDAYEHVWEGMCKQVVEGAIYRDQLLAADKEQRITRVPYDPTKPVHTFWDLGFGDNVSIWLAQPYAFEFKLIDFISNNQKDISFYLKELQNRPYVYGTHYLPHDAKAATLVSGGKTIEQQVRSGGRKVEIVPKLSVEDGIAAARSIFGRCWFDAEKCADGVQALRHYRYEYDEELRTFKKNPRHDWASHPADAFRYFAVAIKEPERKKQEAIHTPYYGESGWMA